METTDGVMTGEGTGMSHLFGGYPELGWTALKAILLFVVAVVGLRLSERRLLAEFSPFDFAVTVAVGAIVGRTATSSNTSFASGAVALVTLLLAHRLVAIMRRRGLLGRLLDRRPLILVSHGRMQAPALRSAGLTRGMFIGCCVRPGRAISMCSSTSFMNQGASRSCGPTSPWRCDAGRARRRRHRQSAVTLVALG